MKRKVPKPNLPGSASSKEDKINATQNPLYTGNEDIYGRAKKGAIDPENISKMKSVYEDNEKKINQS
jgi:hypothetical protein